MAKRMRNEPVDEVMADKDSVPLLITLMVEEEVPRDRLLGETRSPQHGAALIDSLMRIGLVESHSGPIEPSTRVYRLTKMGKELMARL